MKVFCKDCIHYSICDYSPFSDKKIECKDFICKTDYVKVVRCKDCKWWIDKVCTYSGGVYGMTILNPNWFCCAGMRKD